MSAARSTAWSHDATDPWIDAADALHVIYANDADATNELDSAIRLHEIATATGSGYVVDCLRSARHCLREASYEAAVRAAVALGNDTDTTACVTGGLAGIRSGIHGIPQRWTNALRGVDIYSVLLERLLAHTGAAAPGESTGAVR
jgi:ADP-ribosylglycohydrolase